MYYSELQLPRPASSVTDEAHGTAEADFVPLGAVPPDICTGRMTLRLAIRRRVPHIEDVFGNSVRRIQVYDAYFRTHVPMQQVDVCPRGLPLGPVGGFERGNKK